MPITRLYTTGLLPAGPLPDCIPLFCYPHAHNQSVYYCFATNMPLTTLYSTVLFPAGPLPDCILLFCYQHAHYQTVYYWSATKIPITRLYTTGLLPTDQLQRKEQEREEDRRRDRKITSRNGREWGLEIPWGQRKTGKDVKVLSQRHLWCLDDLQD